MKRRRWFFSFTTVAMAVMLSAPLTANAAGLPKPTGLSPTQLSVAMSSMPAIEQVNRAAYFLDPRWVVVGYAQMWVSPDMAASLQTVTTAAGSQTTASPTARSARSGVQPAASGSYVFNGLYISIAVAWDTDITFEYRYDIQAFFDWQGSTVPWNGTTGDDGFAIYWGNSLALLSDFFWGVYRDGTSIGHASREEAPPNQGVGWKFWESKNNSGSIADYGWLTSTVARANFTNTITNFSVKYIHSWANYSYSFSWGAGPSVTFTPTTSTQAISTYASLRT